MFHDEWARNAVGTIWRTECPADVEDSLFLVVEADAWDNRVKVLNLVTGEVQTCPFDSKQRAGDNHWAIFYWFSGKGQWPLIMEHP